MKRGDLVTIALQGAYAKPRPALIIQSDSFQLLESIAVLLITSDLRNAPLLRITIDPTDENGLRAVSQVMIDKPYAVSREKIGRRIGRLDESSLLAINRAISVFFGIG